MSDFWTHLESLITSSSLVIDRPKGSPHPRDPSCIYPLDYGYLDGTSASDGQGIDVWLGSLPDTTLDAIVCTVDTRKRDAEIKLLIGCTCDEKQTVYNFHQGTHVGVVLLERETSRSYP